LHEIDQQWQFELLFYVSVVQKLEHIIIFGEFLVLAEQRTNWLVTWTCVLVSLLHPTESFLFSALVGR